MIKTLIPDPSAGYRQRPARTMEDIWKTYRTGQLSYGPYKSYFGKSHTSNGYKTRLPKIEYSREPIQQRERERIEQQPKPIEQKIENLDEKESDTPEEKIERRNDMVESGW